MPWDTTPMECPMGNPTRYPWDISDEMKTSMGYLMWHNIPHGMVDYPMGGFPPGNIPWGHLSCMGCQHPPRNLAPNPNPDLMLDRWAGIPSGKMGDLLGDYPPWDFPWDYLSYTGYQHPPRNVNPIPKPTRRT